MTIRQLATRLRRDGSGRAAISTATLMLAAGLATPAAAQSPPTQLPPVVVQGATLAKPKAPAQRESGDDQPAPQPQASQPAQAPTQPAAAQTAAGGGGDAPPANADAAATAGGVPASSVGSAVTVVTRAELEQRQVRTAVEALQSLPGVSVTRNSSQSSLTEVRLRGAEGNHTLVMIDGVVANDPTNGAYDFSDLSVGDIERIEVIRGAQSVIYGSGAVGGAINIITRSGAGPARVTARTEVGSFGTRDAALSVSGGSDRLWGAANYQVRDSRGFNIAPKGSEKDASRLETFALRGGVLVAPGLTVDGSIRYSRKQGDRDGFGGPPLTLATALDDPSRFTSDVFLGSIRARWETFGGNFVQEVRSSVNRTETTDTDLSFPAFPFLSHYLSDTRTSSYLATVKLPGAARELFEHSLTGFVERQDETFASLGDFADGLTRSRNRLAYAGEWRAKLMGQLDVTAGLRRDDNSAFDDFTSWRATASWAIPGTGIRPHASAGTGFKAPSFFEQFGSIPSFYNPNPNLKPETSEGWDAGIELTFWGKRAILDVTYFSADLTDKISRNPSGFAPTLVNLAGVSHRQGVEVSNKLIVAPGITLGTAYTYLEATDSTGTQETRRPPHSGRIDLDAKVPGMPLRLHVGAVYNGRATDLAFRTGAGPFDAYTTEIVSLDAWWKLDAAVSYQLTKTMEIFGRVENALDQRTQQVYGYQQPGIAAYGGMKITFGEKD